MTKTAEEYRKMADKKDEEARESFDRCDTDGFLTQYADGIMADVYRKQAMIIENDGKWTFPGLFTTDGKRVKARLIKVYNQYAHAHEWKWLVLVDEANGGNWFAPAYAKRTSTLGKYGLKEDDEMIPAKAKIQGSGYGLSGTAWAGVIRLDKGYPENAIEYPKP